MTANQKAFVWRAFFAVAGMFLAGMAWIAYRQWTFYCCYDLMK